MLHTKFPENRPTSSGEEDWSCDPDAPHKFGLNQVVLEKKIFEHCGRKDAGP